MSILYFENGNFVRDTIITPSIIKTDTVKRTITNHEFGAYFGYDKKLFSETIFHAGAIFLSPSNHASPIAASYL